MYAVVISLYAYQSPFLYIWYANTVVDPVSRGEMSAMFPVSGAFAVFGTRFVSPALGFTLGEDQVQTVINL